MDSAAALLLWYSLKTSISVDTYFIIGSYWQFTQRMKVNLKLAISTFLPLRKWPDSVDDQILSDKICCGSGLITEYMFIGFILSHFLLVFGIIWLNTNLYSICHFELDVPLILIHFHSLNTRDIAIMKYQW